MWHMQQIDNISEHDLQESLSFFLVNSKTPSIIVQLILIFLLCIQKQANN